MSNPTATPMIHVEDLRVDYAQTTAVHNLDLTIGPGEIVGLVGPNGAGKTSTIRVLATLMEPTHGRVSIAGFDIAEAPQEVRRILGYMPDTPPVEEALRCWEMLDLYGACHGLEGTARRERVDTLLERVGLADKRHAFCGELSRGMARLILAKTLLHEPRVLLLDEPASALDPIARIDLRDTLRALAAEGHTILISSHILSELADMCSLVGIMDHGRLTAFGKIDELSVRLSHHRQLHIRLEATTEDIHDRLKDLPGVLSVEVEDARLRLLFDGADTAQADLLAAMIQRGLRITEFTEKKLGLEEIMLRSRDGGGAS